MPKICLSFVFNNQFEKNIPKLKHYYGNRFSAYRYLSPFSQSIREEIIPVHETSINFQGYFAQAYTNLPRDYDYYVFCGDDLILNPNLNENNLIDALKCNDAAYIKYLNPVWEHSFVWHKFDECNNFPSDNLNIPTQQLLPDRISLLKLYAKHGFIYRNLGTHNFYSIKENKFTKERLFSGILYFLKNKLSRYVHFPLIEGFSDLIIIPQKNLKEFCHYCGIFSALNLWVDAAIATSIVLSTEEVCTEDTTKLKGIELWNEQEIESKLAPTKYQINHLPKIFKNEDLYIHPIKLSRFK